jgi:hypothetical protein
VRSTGKEQTTELSVAKASEMKLTSRNRGKELCVQRVPRTQSSGCGAFPLSFFADTREESAEWCRGITGGESVEVALIGVVGELGASI